MNSKKTAKKTAKKSTRKTTRKATTKARAARKPDVAEQLEQAFLAGLGALSNAKDVGNKAFESLVDQGLNFRKKTTKKTEALIDNVQDAIRDMTDDAQSRASGLMGQMRETPQLAKLQSVFDSRVADALDRIGVASKHDIDAINKKLDSVLRSLAAKKAAKADVARKKVAKKTSKKKASKKKVAGAKAAKKRVSAKKAPAKKAPAKKAPAKKAPGKKKSTKRASTTTAATQPVAASATKTEAPKSQS